MTHSRPSATPCSPNPRHTPALRDRRVLITGAARGIGAGLADLLTAHGARVALSGLEPELLAEVEARTGFLCAFPELRSGRAHSNPQAVLAAILADATNLGIERMANASQGVTYAQLAWTHGWYVSEENYAAGLRHLVDAQAALPLTRVWGDGTASSSDGQFFRSGRRGAAGSTNARYDREPGQKIYAHVADTYAPYHVRLISATAAEAPYVLDGLVAHGCGIEPATHYADTGGASDHVFALAHLLGFRFVPRLRDLADRRLGLFPGTARPEALAKLIGRPFNIAAIRERWDEIVRLAASVKAGVVLPSVMLKKLAAYRRQNRLDFALQELGRIERTLFTLDWIEQPEQRRRATRELNKGEAENALKRAIFFHRIGRIRDHALQAQSHRASALNLVAGAIVLWNTTYLQAARMHLANLGRPVPPDLLQHLSPLGWQHINLTGDYLWTDPDAPSTALRPLRQMRAVEGTAKP